MLLGGNEVLMCGSTTLNLLLPKVLYSDKTSATEWQMGGDGGGVHKQLLGSGGVFSEEKSLL